MCVWVCVCLFMPLPCVNPVVCFLHLWLIDQVGSQATYMYITYRTKMFTPKTQKSAQKLSIGKSNCTKGISRYTKSSFYGALGI